MLPAEFNVERSTCRILPCEVQGRAGVLKRTVLFSRRQGNQIFYFRLADLTDLSVQILLSFFG